MEVFKSNIIQSFLPVNWLSEPIERGRKKAAADDDDDKK